MSHDTIRDRITARAAELDLTAYRIAKDLGMSPETVKRYLCGRCSLNTRYVSRLAERLGLELREKK